MKNSCLPVKALVACLIFTFPIKGHSQLAEVRNAVYSDVSIPLRDMKPVKHAFWKKWTVETEKEHEVPNKFRNDIPAQVPDNALQTEYNDRRAMALNPVINFNGLNNSNNTGARYTPPTRQGMLALTIMCRL